MSAYVKNNILYKPIKRGQAWRIQVRIPGIDFNALSGVLMGFKPKLKLEGDPVILLSLGDGITIVDTDLIAIEITKADTLNLRYERLYSDLKIFTDPNDPKLMLSAIIEIQETVTPMT